MGIFLPVGQRGGIIRVKEAGESGKMRGGCCGERCGEGID